MNGEHSQQPDVRPTDERFDSCEHDDMEAEFDGKHVTIQESGGMAILTPAEAGALRDFLNKVLS
jgi:hypothetical protein